MKIIKIILCCLATMGISPALMAQSHAKAEERPPVNRVDAAGKQHGWWMSEHAPRMGEPGYSEFGMYSHGRKTGQWYKLDLDGELLAIEGYKNNALDGEVKYFDDGRLTSVGHYRGLNPAHPTDTILVEHPITGEQKLVTVASDRGSLRHGSWRYYDPESGRMLREEDYQVDELVYAKDFKMSHEDSLYYFQRAANLPHTKKGKVKPPGGRKKVSYLNY